MANMLKQTDVAGTIFP